MKLTERDVAFMKAVKKELYDRIVGKGLEYEEMHAEVLSVVRRLGRQHHLVWLLPQNEYELADRFAKSIEAERLKRIRKDKQKE